MLNRRSIFLLFFISYLPEPLRSLPFHGRETVLPLILIYLKGFLVVSLGKIVPFVVFLVKILPLFNVNWIEFPII